MTIKRIKERLEESYHPVQINIYSDNNFKACIIGFKKGMVLKEHKTCSHLKIFVLEGVITSIAANAEGGIDTQLKKHEEHEIEKDSILSFIANADCLCLITHEKG